jgi:hypothetical protein
VVTVYLDQAKWIDLARALHGRSDGERFRDALDVARHSVAMGMVEFPLSTGHYIETWRVGDLSRRRRLAKAMIELSQGRTLARPPDLCDTELDALLARTAGGPVPRPPWPPLGWGFAHASGLTPDFRRSQLDLDHELRHLAQRPDGFEGHGRGHREFGDRYRDGERQLVARDYQLPADLDEAVIASSAVLEIHENVAGALERAGLPAEVLGPIGRARPDLPREQIHEVVNGLLPVARAFIAELPTREAALRLRLQRHKNPNARWESNDMVDIAYLACAVVHCDIVATEKQWVHELRQSGLLEDHGTHALNDIATLPEVLVELVR